MSARALVSGLIFKAPAITPAAAVAALPAALTKAAIRM
jgi:hypothetical protein